ncbi:MAG TPA: hypothetical protein VM935_15305 [Chitinophagaceae bacterium]|nr:hypothetical protein [Chitinophagaceae bacterium]
MNFSIPILELELPGEDTGGNQKKPVSYEYELIASMVLQQYQREGEVLFDRLLTMQESERIPALMVEYGAPRMYRVILSMLKNFSFYPFHSGTSITKHELHECVSNLLAAADEHDLSLEDFVLFFERAKSGYYGILENTFTTETVLEKFERYLGEREKAMVELARQKTVELKALGNADRLQTDPIRIGEILDGATVVNMNKKMSG